MWSGGIPGVCPAHQHIEMSVKANDRLGEVLASAGDDGNILLWVPAENQTPHTNFEEGLEDKETWRVKHMCRSMGSEIYDLAWSPDGVFFITGSMDNIARIYNAQTGTAPCSRLHFEQLLTNKQELACGRLLSTTTTSRASHGIRSTSMSQHSPRTARCTSTP